jgi:hypothetical protein
MTDYTEHPVNSEMTDKIIGVVVVVVPLNLFGFLSFIITIPIVTVYFRIVDDAFRNPPNFKDNYSGDSPLHILYGEDDDSPDSS